MQKWYIFNMWYLIFLPQINPFILNQNNTWYPQRFDKDIFLPSLIKKVEVFQSVSVFGNVASDLIT